jgi:hypothetical protein
MTPLEYVQRYHADAVKMPLGAWLLANPPPTIVDPKVDGKRVFYFLSNGKSVYATKHTGVYTKASHSALFSGIPPFRVKSAVLDCEVYPRVHPYMTAVFDVLEVDDIDIKWKPLQERKTILSGLFMDTPTFAKLRYEVADSAEEILRLKESFVSQGFEGAMVKNPLSTYGVTNAWLKLKHRESYDFVVLRPDPENDTYKRTGISHSWYIGLYDPYGQIQEWGKVGSYLEGVDPALVTAGTVVEVEFQETTKDKKLRDPFITSLRPDKVPEECKTTQLEVI